MTAIDIIIIVLMAAALTAVIVGRVRNRGKYPSCCEGCRGCSCASCCDSCPREKEQEEKTND